MKLVFLGPPGAGKGTQALNISKKLGIPHISTGDMFRYAIKNETATGRKAKVYMDEGKLVPDEIVIEMVRERLEMPDAAEGFLLDGFPRSDWQADQLEGIARPDAVINIAVKDEDLLERLTGRRVCRECGGTHHIKTLTIDSCPVCGGELYQRDDDKPDTIRNRLAVYHEQTSPLIEYYAADGRLLTVNGTVPPDEVCAQIVDELEKFL